MPRTLQLELGVGSVQGAYRGHRPFVHVSLIGPQDGEAEERWWSLPPDGRYCLSLASVRKYLGLCSPWSFGGLPRISRLLMPLTIGDGRTDRLGRNPEGHGGFLRAAPASWRHAAGLLLRRM